MKKYKLFLILALCIAAPLGCSSAIMSKHPVQITSIKIGLSVYDSYDTYIGLLNNCFQRYAKEKELESGLAINIMYSNAAGNQQLQNSHIEDFINADCDILCVNLVDRTYASVIIDNASNANVPVIFFNREPVEEDLGRWSELYYVGSVARESGQLQGQMLVDLASKDLNRIDRNGDGVLQYVMLEGEAGHQDAIMRTEYAVSTIRSAGYSLLCLANDIANFNRAQAESKMSQWWTDYHDKIEIVFANNDDMALGAIDFLENANVPLNRWPVILGIDGTPDGLEAVAQEKMYGTILNDANGQANAMMALLYSIATQTPLPQQYQLMDERYIRLPHQMITKENVEQFAYLFDFKSEG